MARPQKHGRKCAFESLETRQMMAGDVIVKVDNGNMKITGDNLSNGIILAPGINPFEIVVTGFNQGGAATRVNGVANGAITFPNVTKNVSINMGSGNDFVSVAGVNIYESAKIKTGRGLDTLQISASFIADKLKVTTGKGFDRVTIANTTVAGKTKIQTGPSRDEVNLSNLTVGKLNVQLGRGNDSLSISGLNAIRPTVLNGGSGINTLTLNGSNYFGSGLLKKNLAG
jgi:hypothetical protein